MPAFQNPDDLTRLFCTRPARIDLTGTDLSGPLLRLVVDEMRTNNTCTDLVLNNCNVGKDIGHVTNAMIQNQGLRLRTFVARGNNIGGLRQCVHLARLVGVSTTLLHLDLAGNKLAEDNHGLSSLFAALTTKLTCPLLFLDLSTNDLNLLDVPQVDQLLQARPQLFLGVHGNEVTRRPDMRPALQMLNARHRSTMERLAQLCQASTATNRSRSTDRVPPISENSPDKGPAPVIQNTPSGMAPPAALASASTSAPAAPSSASTTRGKLCANCNNPVVEFQYRCCTCPGFRFCVPCYEKHLRRPLHSADHTFVGSEVVPPPPVQLPPKVDSCSTCGAPQPDCKCHVAASSNEALPPRAPPRMENTRSATPLGAAASTVSGPRSGSPVPDHDLSGADDDEVDESTPIASPRAAAAKRSSSYGSGRSAAPSQPPRGTRPDDEEPTVQREERKDEDEEEEEADEGRPEEQVPTVEAEAQHSHRSASPASGAQNSTDLAKQLAAATVVSRRTSDGEDGSQKVDPPAAEDAKPPQPGRRPWEAGKLKNALSSQILAQLRNLGIGSDDEGSEEEAEAAVRAKRPATARERLESSRPRPSAPEARETPSKATSSLAVKTGSPRRRRGRGQKPTPSAPVPQSAPTSPHAGMQGFLPDRNERVLLPAPTASSAPRIPLTYLARPPTDIAVVVNERCKRAAKGKHGPPTLRDTFAAFVPPAALANGRLGPGAYAKDVTKTPFVRPTVGQHRPPTGYNTRGRPVWHM
eukprot:GGOE01002402.1.p1 GENE.GGOE01002402.1~~GGOE01002402.1.p1  ORF type:complete len:754 (+),score=141.08 GGOE01002402.1:59-2320(+)